MGRLYKNTEDDKTIGPEEYMVVCEEKQEGLGQMGRGEEGGRRHVETSDTTDMINEFTEI